MNVEPTGVQASTGVVRQVQRSVALPAPSKFVLAVEPSERTSTQVWSSGLTVNVVDVVTADLVALVPSRLPAASNASWSGMSPWPVPSVTSVLGRRARPSYVFVRGPRTAARAAAAETDLPRSPVRLANRALANTRAPKAPCPARPRAAAHLHQG